MFQNVFCLLYVVFIWTFTNSFQKIYFRNENREIVLPSLKRLKILLRTSFSKILITEFYQSLILKAFKRIRQGSESSRFCPAFQISNLQLFPQKTLKKRGFPFLFSRLKKFFEKIFQQKKMIKIFFEELFPQRDISCLFITQKVRMKKKYHTKSDKIWEIQNKKGSNCVFQKCLRGFPDLSRQMVWIFSVSNSEPWNNIFSSHFLITRNSSVFSRKRFHSYLLSNLVRKTLYRHKIYSSLLPSISAISQVFPDFFLLMDQSFAFAFKKILPKNFSLFFSRFNFSKNSHQFFW